MNITMNNAIGQYNTFNFTGVDKKENEEAKKKKLGLNSLHDSVSISEVGKAMSLVDSLNKQKENLQKRREELLQKSLAGEDVEAELEKLNKQMLEIEDKITNTTQEEIENNEKYNAEKTIKAEPKTKEEAMSQKMNNVISSSIGLNQIEITYSAQSRLESNARILRAEANTSQGEMKVAKLKQAAELESMALALNKKMSKQIENVEEELVEVKEPSKKIDEAHQEKENTEKEYKEDKEHITIDVVL
ncbi:hypothetical protein AN639_03045 [Candidatus Epulonipiscium fishelsonii]|uniref:Uncharacterized protein n=1 Tax=Candidatus Epulonipiscium fishelsonii TaxID=77094 RepID=A0ACC8X9E0_9FIRM|nr:hypothetical protein AN396_01445 [Epulopiscium sp. SCG-B11WGA-EpuloA1]ONI41719.1 hypothetical protein AN639_03045 [Epulopiscium sp. SCG-B05WGA-EpuloA1]